MKFILLLILLALLIQIHLGIDDSLIERDLYKDLGLKNNASVKEIKKAFRSLAQVHHPDKSKPNEKEINEVIFREVATAYEVLGNADQKNEYDTRRSRRGNGNPSRRGSNQQQTQEDMYSSFFSFDDWSEDVEANYDSGNSFRGYHPIISGPILYAMQIIHPYSPIIISEDRSHFALLDMHCSLGVYRGDVDILIRHLLIADQPPDLTMMPLELKFRTEGAASLNGECFAWLDERGRLRVYRGNPDYPHHTQPIWSSDPPKENIYSSHFQRFYLELSSTGELAVRLREAGDSESQCIWSTTSCNAYMAALKDLQGQISQMLSELGQDLKEIVASLEKKAQVLIKKLHMKDLFRNMKEKLGQQASKFWKSKRYLHIFDLFKKVKNNLIHQASRFWNKMQGKPDTQKESYKKRPTPDENVNVPGDSNYNSGANRRERRRREAGGS